MNYEEAVRLKKRVFYEGSTQTIRTVPENYCLACRYRLGLSKYKWRAIPDAAFKTLSEEEIQNILDTWGKGSTGGGLADIIERKIKNQRSNQGYNYS